MKARNIIVGSIVAVGATAIAAKKLVADDELNKKVREDGKKAIDSLKELGKSVGAVAKNTVDNVAYEAKSIKDEVVEKIKEQEPEIESKVAERKESIKAAADEAAAKIRKAASKVEETVVGDTNEEVVEDSKVDFEEKCVTYLDKEEIDK